MKARAWIRLNGIVSVLKFVLNNAGKEYGISRFKKVKVAKEIIRRAKHTETMASWEQHLILTQEIFSIPKSLKGDIVECGCAAGGTSISLSIACAFTGRKLFVCDSFEGLPEPKDNEAHEIHDDLPDHTIWEEGEFAFSLNHVKDNISKYGNVEVCEFVKGYFKDTLKDINTDSIVMVLEDADLPSSVEDCLRYLWPKLKNGCKFFSHEPWSIGVVSLFYNADWWKKNLNTTPPGFYGSGLGVLSGIGPTTIGYTKKFDAERVGAKGVS